MEASTEIEKPTGTELSEQDEAALASKIRGKVDKSSLKLPLVKLAQALTNEVVDGRARSGDFINSVTTESYGSEFQFIIADTFLGRFARIDGKGYNAQGPVAPDNWPPKYAGRAFAEIEDAEENFKAAVNSGEREFGNGPPISTTHNYVGLIVGEDFDERAAENRLLPVRLSLMRKNAKAAQTIDYLLLTWPAPWARRIKVSSFLDKNAAGDQFYVAQVSEGEAATTLQRSAAVNLASAAQSAKIELQGDDDGEEKPTPPPETDGMEVG